MTTAARETALSIVGEALGQDGVKRVVESAVDEELERLRVRAEARRRFDAERDPNRDRPLVVTWLDDEPDDDVDWRVEGLLAAGGRMLLAAQAKAGKTTLAANLCHALLTGYPFLGRHRVRRVDGAVAFLNFEVTDRQARRWLRDVGGRRRWPVCRRIGLRVLTTCMPESRQTRSNRQVGSHMIGRSDECRELRRSADATAASSASSSARTAIATPLRRSDERTRSRAVTVRSIAPLGAQRSPRSQTALPARAAAGPRTAATSSTSITPTTDAATSTSHIAGATRAGGPRSYGRGGTP